MTIKLYDEDAYNTKFSAKVLSCEEDSRGFSLVLDRTLFFPEEGGQTPDRGTINGLDVSYVSIKDGIISHYVSQRIEPGCEVIGEILFSHRFSNMQMHSAEHIFSGLVHSKFGYDNVGFHLSDNDATMDYNGKLSDEDVYELEREVNDVIYASKAIKTWYPEDKELADLDFRSKAGIQGDVRMVEIEDIDLCACCAPHVKSTSEIGIFKIVRFESYKGGIRLHYLAGKRAYEYLSNICTDVNLLSKLLSVSTDKVLSGVEKMSEEIKSLKISNGLLIKRKFSTDIFEKALGDGYKDSPVDKNIYFIFDKEAVAYLRFITDEIHKYYKGFSLAIAGDDETGYRFILESGFDNYSKFFDDFKNSFKVKCGGRNNSFQGSLEGNGEEIEEFLTEHINL